MKRFQNLSYKTLFTILFFGLAGIVFFLKIGGKTTKVSAAWWDDSWHYRLAIIINNNTGYDATNIPYKANLDTQTLISAGKLQSDADDIRVVDSNGNIVRSQVEKSTLNTTVTKVWFEATVKNGNSATYYIYYGNATTSAPNFPTDIQSFSNTSSSTTIQMKDGFTYGTTNGNGGRVGDISKNGSEIGVDGNINYSNSFPGQWWTASTSQTILNSTGPLFVEVVYSSGATGSYSAYESDVKVFDNGFGETRLFVTYNASGSEQFYYYLPFTNGTRNSVWVNSSGTLIDQATDSGTLYQADLGQNWFGQRWTATGKYGGTIITKNGSDWYNGYTSAQASYYQTNYSTTLAFTNGSTREVRFGVFGGDGGLTEMAQKGANYGGLSSTLKTEEASVAPIVYWKFDEGIGSTINDSSSLKNQGVTGGNTLPTWVVDDSQCISGKCLFFPGGGGWGAGSKVTASKQVPLTGSFTISHWIKTSLATGQMYTIANTGGGDGYRFGLNNGKIGFLIGNSSGYTEKTCGIRSLNDNTWHLITGVFDNTNHTFSCYSDGKFEASTSIVDFTGMTTTAPGIGSPPCCQIFVGYIDDVKIYPYARTANQIKQDYNSRGSMSGSGVNLGVKSNTAPSLKSGLVGYWKLDEGQGSLANNSISGGANFTLGSGASSPSWTNEAKTNKSLSFINTSNQYAISVIDSGVLKSTNETGSFTLSAWVKPGTQTGSERVILGRAGCHGGLVANSSNQFSFNVAATDCWTSGIALSSGTISNWTSWHHIVGVYSNKSVKIYVDGILKNSGTLSGSMFNYDNGMYIGAIGSYGFNGLIDEVKIYNKALTADEVKQDYNSGSSIKFGTSNQTIGGTTTSLQYCIPGDTSYCAAPIAEYNFEENTGTTAKDTSGNNHNGTISSATWAVGQKNKGSSLKFDGTNSYVDIGTSFGTLSSYTISFWAKHDATGRMPFGSKGNVNFYWYGDNSWKYIHGGTSGEYYYPHQANIPTGTWGFFTVTYDGAKVSIYRNGIFEGSQSTSGSADFSSGFLIGSGYVDNSSYRFIGQIDNVKIYNYARTPAQVAYDYNRGGPIAWWKFDECQGSTVFDSSGLGSTGVISIGQSGSQTSLGTCQTGTSAAWTNGSSGHSNGSLNFDGTDDYVSMNNIPIASSGSMSVWIKPNNNMTPPVSGYPGIVRYNSDPGIYIQQGTGKPYLQALSGAAVSSTALIANQWQHLVGVFYPNGSNTTLNLYLNSKLVATTNGTGTINSNLTTFELSGITRFSGQIDDVRVYNYALTLEQIKQIYNGGAINFQ